MKKTIPVQKQILEYIRKHKSALTDDLVAVLKISRQAVAKHLKKMTTSGLIHKTGSTKKARYHYKKTTSEAPEKPALARLTLVKKMDGLLEDNVFEELSLRMNLKRRIPKNIYLIAMYAFTEMLNNAIDHSKSKTVKIDFSLEYDQLKFEIRDSGIGIFFNVMKNFSLKTEFEGLEHLLKGKQTTFPERHTGQGIFFTSRIADVFQAQSHKITLTVDNLQKDLFAKESRFVKGTVISFTIKRKSRKNLKEIFDQYAGEDYEFDRADYRVKLTAERSLLSRSQAKRILAGLDSYKKLIFDFSKVKEIGQSFADEIFRVY